MKKLFFIPVFILAYLVVIGTINAAPKHQKAVIKKDEFGLKTLVYGPDNAPHHMIVAMSLSCQLCADLHKKDLHKIIAEYADTGKCQITIVDMPFLGMMPAQSSMFLMQMPDNVYEKMVGLLFKNQEKWVKAWPDKSFFKKFATLAGFQEAEYENLFKNDELRTALYKRNFNYTKKYNIDGTPAFVLNGIMIDIDPKYEAIKKALDHALNTP